MASSHNATSLLERVRSRLTAADAARRLHYATLAGIAFAAVAILAVRLGGLLPPDQQNLQWLLLLSVPVALVTAMMHRKVGQDSAARVVDGFAGTNDLFLTLASIGDSAGEYQPLVLQAAEQKSQGIDAAEVVPYRPQKPLAVQLGGFILLALLVLLLPTLDPFGKVEAAAKNKQEQKEVQQLLQIVQTRREQVARKVQTAEEREEQIRKRSDELMQQLRAMKPAQQQSNSEALTGQKNEFNQMWKMLSSDELQKMLGENASQLFGSEQNRQMNEWLRELQEGKADSLQQQLERAQETMQSMLNAETPEERQQLASQLRKDLEELRKFSSRKAGSKDLENSLDQALKALEALSRQESGRSAGENSDSEQAEMQRQAREALEQSLQNSQTELQELARSAKDLKKLEEALRTLQQAQKLNKQGQLSGEECEDCQTMEDYARRFAQQMGGRTGASPRSEPGSMMDEDDGDPEGYRDEKSRSQIQAGKVLLSIRTKEDATEKDFDPEELRQYQNSVQSVKSGVQAAIESEQIPPGYVDGIRGYFDRIPDQP